MGEGRGLTNNDNDHLSLANICQNDRIDQIEALPKEIKMLHFKWSGKSGCIIIRMLDSVKSKWKWALYSYKYNILLFRFNFKFKRAIDCTNLVKHSTDGLIFWTGESFRWVNRFSRRLAGTMVLCKFSHLPQHSHTNSQWPRPRDQR